MKKISFVLVALVVGLFLLFPALSFAQKGKKTTANKTTPKKTTTKTTSNQSTETKWVNLKVEECGFSVDFPGKPEKKVVGSAIYWSIFLETERYTVSCEPASRNDLLNQEAFLNGFVAGWEGDIVSKGKVLNNNNLGREIIANNPNNWAEWVGIFVVPKREVTVAVLGSSPTIIFKDNKAVAEKIRKFVYSLKLF